MTDRALGVLEYTEVRPADPAQLLDGPTRTAEKGQRGSRRSNCMAELKCYVERVTTCSLSRRSTLHVSTPGGSQAFFDFVNRQELGPVAG